MERRKSFFKDGFCVLCPLEIYLKKMSSENFTNLLNQNFLFAHLEVPEEKVLLEAVLLK